ncbi:MAG TPA: hypothetical protein VGF33_10020 [Caulobacteraceae bacterium]|jgi:hypothetical protein
MIDRTEVSRALAKACAFKDCGKHAQAAQWAIRLIDLLEQSDIISDTIRADVATRYFAEA